MRDFTRPIQRLVKVRSWRFAADSSHVSVESRVNRAILKARATGILLGVVIAVGCGKTPVPVDTSNAPWLDPAVQIGNLKDKDFRVRGIAAFNLGNMGAQAAPAVAELERLAQEDTEPKVRERAKEAVEKIRAAH